jgi:hypothetical protein
MVRHKGEHERCHGRSTHVLHDPNDSLGREVHGRARAGYGMVVWYGQRMVVIADVAAREEGSFGANETGL